MGWATVSVPVPVVNSWPAASSVSRSSARFSMMPLCTMETRDVPCVAPGRRAMRRPAGVADAGRAGKRRTFQHRFQLAELALGAAAVDVAVHQGGNPGAVVAAIFQPPQRIQQHRRRRPRPDHAHDPAPGLAPPLPGPTTRAQGRARRAQRPRRSRCRRPLSRRCPPGLRSGPDRRDGRRAG